MANQRNIWKYFDGYKIYSDEKQKLNKICKEADGKFVGEYFTKKGKLIAWDIFVPSNKIILARKIINEK